MDQKHGQSKLGNRFLSLLCILALFAGAAIPSFAAPTGDEYFIISDTNHRLFVNKDQEVHISDISVDIDGTVYNGNEVSWSSANPQITVESGIIKATATGIYSLTVQDTGLKVRIIPILVKEIADKDFLIYYDDFSTYSNGAMPTGWITAKNSDTIASVPTGHDT